MRGGVSQMFGPRAQIRVVRARASVYNARHTPPLKQLGGNSLRANPRRKPARDVYARLLEGFLKKLVRRRPDTEQGGAVSTRASNAPREAFQGNATRDSLVPVNLRSLRAGCKIKRH